MLGSEVLSSIRGAEMKGIQSKHGMLYNSFIIGAFPFFDNTIIQILFFFYFEESMPCGLYEVQK